MVSYTSAYGLKAGDLLSDKYRVVSMLGGGYEGEVFKVEETLTKTNRAIKLFYPKRNENFRVSLKNAKKLNKLADCPIVLDYHFHDVLELNGEEVACLVCEYIDGKILGEFVEKQRNKRLGIFPSIHLLYSIVCGLEMIHLLGEYHGDLHTDNIIIKHFGLEFEMKIIDFHDWEDSKKANKEEDIIKTIRIFYDILGGAKVYPKLPPSIKYIICGLKRNLILKRFRTVTHLKNHLELMDWSDAII